MIIKFSTERDRNGNRYYLAFDTNKKEFSLESQHWYCKEDVIIIGKRDRRALIETLKNENYTEINYM